MSKKVILNLLSFVLIFSLSFSIVNAQFKEGTCKNPNGGTYCGGKSQLSKCYCDSACKGYADCCLDYLAVCLKVGGDAGKTPSICPQISLPYCPNGTLVSGGVDQSGCPLPHKCVPKSICTDSDGGLNYNLFGTTNGFKAFLDKVQSNIVTEKDSCTTICSGSVGSGISGSGPCLIEYYCDKNNYAAFSVYQCPYGCKDGACLKEKPPVCGNNVCEQGEADYCPLCTTQPCPLAPCKSGSCPQDCKKPECVTDADCQVSCIKAPCPKYSCVNGECVFQPITTCGNGVCEESEKICTKVCPMCPSNINCPPCTEECKYVCPQDCKKPCPEVYKPVCGADGKTYSSSCTAEAAGVKIACDGQCPCKTQITKQDVINWINNNCYNTYTTTDSITGAIIKKVPIIIN